MLWLIVVSVICFSLFADILLPFFFFFPVSVCVVFEYHVMGSMCVGVVLPPSEGCAQPTSSRLLRYRSV